MNKEQLKNGQEIANAIKELENDIVDWENADNYWSIGIFSQNGGKTHCGKQLTSEITAIIKAIALADLNRQRDQLIQEFEAL